MAIQIQIDNRIRLVSSILLLTKFVDENSGHKFHPLKVKSIDFLKAFEDHPCVTASRQIAESQWMSAFYCYAVLLERKSDSWTLQKEVEVSGYIEDFEKVRYFALLQSFCEDTKIEWFWEQTKDQWQEVQNDCLECLQESKLDDFLDLLFGINPYQLVLIPNPVDPSTFGFGPTDGKVAYCILGPPDISPDSPDPVRFTRYGRQLAYFAFHEFSHSLWDHTRQEFPAFLEKTASLEDMMHFKGWFPEMYETWENRLNEIFIRAATAAYHEYLEGEASAWAILDKEKEEFGIDLIDRMFLCLRRYLGGRRRGEFQNLREYLPELAEELTDF